jgi:1-deoxy-D-xylulose-5-phosphate reductoisomerase
VLYALTHPDRIDEPAIQPFDPVAASPLTFERVRLDDFPALRLGIEAGRTGGAAPAVFNAANEKAVALFLDGALSFVDIARAISAALDRLGGLPGNTREELIMADAAARDHVSGQFKR